MKKFLAQILAFVLKFLLKYVLPSPQLRRFKPVDRGTPVDRELVFSYRRQGEVPAKILKRDLGRVLIEKRMQANAYRIMKTENLPNGEQWVHVQPYQFSKEEQGQEDEVPSAVYRYEFERM